MTYKTKQKITLIVTLLVAAAVWAWFYPLNTGEVVLYTGKEDFQVNTSQKKINCKSSPCNIQHQAGSYTFTITKEGYAPSQKSLQIRRGSSQAAEVELIKIVSLKKSQTIPVSLDKSPKKPIPPSLNASKGVKPAWNQTETKLAYLDTEDGRFKIWDGSSSQVVTPLNESEMTLVWSASNRNIVGISKDAVTIFNISQGSRQKIPAQNITGVKWTPSEDAVLISDAENKVQKVNAKTLATKTLNTRIPLKLSAWTSDESLIYALAQPEDNRVSIRTYNLAEDVSAELAGKFNFAVDRVVYNTENKTAYFHNPNEKLWYEMKF